MIRPGLDDSTRTRSASSTASSMLCVTIRIDLTGALVPFPQLDELAAQVLRGQHVEGGERLVHQQRVRLGDDGAGEADPLPHAAGQLLGVGGLEAVQADQVDRLERPLGPLGLGDAAGLEAELDVLLDGEPGQQREGLEDHRHPRVGPGQRGAPVGDGAGRRGDQPGDAAQQGRLARPRLAEQRDDLALGEGEADAVEHGQGMAVGGGERLGHRLGLDDHRAGPRRCFAAHHRVLLRSAGRTTRVAGSQRVPPFG